MKTTALRFPGTDQPARQIIAVLVICFASVSVCSSQDLYDLQHSVQYANYLSSSHQYKLAAEEYERLVFLDSTNVSFKADLVRSYRLSGDFSRGINRVYSFYGNRYNTMPPSVAAEFLKLETMTDSLFLVNRFIAGNSSLTANEKTIFNCFSLLLEGNYREASQLTSDASRMFPGFPAGISGIVRQANDIKYKSPFLAGSLSCLVPGTGKFYTGDWADGLFSMIFIAGSAWQAYRGFKQHGSKSAYGWTFAGISASFYLGNVYGSVKAAKRFNKIRKDDIDNQVHVFINSDSY